MLSQDQRAKLTAEAERRGIDADKLIAAAEKRLSGDVKADKKPVAPSAEPKPLYMYHLPFVTVNEVRETWLGLDPIPGGEMNAAKYAAEQSAPVKTDPPPAE